VSSKLQLCCRNTSHIQVHCSFEVRVHATNVWSAMCTALQSQLTLLLQTCPGVLFCRLLTYLTAVSEYCAALSSDLTLCHSEPLCQVLLFAGNATVLAESEPVWATAGDWLQALSKSTRQECWPDWLRILNQECTGSRHAQVKKCLALPRTDRNADSTGFNPYGLYPSTDNTCLQGCMSLCLEDSEFPTRHCLPPWMLHEVCGGGSCVTAVDGAPEGSQCKVEDALFDMSDGSFSNTCNVSVAYVRSTSWADFSGSCPHRRAVAPV
jgi:hypothetical protein